MRNMSFALTTEQYRNGTKDVTRRLHTVLKPGDEFMGIEKGMGLKKGEKMKRIGPSMVITVTTEPLRRMIEDKKYGEAEVIREGFPKLSPVEFVVMFCRTHAKCYPDTLVHRIEFKRFKLWGRIEP